MLMMAPFYKVFQRAMSMREHAQYQSPGMSSPKWVPAIIYVRNSISAFPALAGPNVCLEEGKLACEDLLISATHKVNDG